MFNKIELWVRQKRNKSKTKHLPQKQTGLSLDAGCGKWLYPADIYIDINVENRPSGHQFVISDIQAIPFKSKAFTFGHCSNVIEHLSEPELGYSELKRISFHGYVE